jgi:CRISPR-associated protein Cmr3
MDDRMEQTKSGILVEVDGDNGLLPSSGLLSMGGEGRTLAYKKVTDLDWSWVLEPVESKIMSSGRFKMYLVSPAIFRNGWYPDFLKCDDYSSLSGNLPNTELRVILRGACVGRSMPIGGFEVFFKRRRPKDILRAVPSGSVYFFQLADWDTWSQETKQQNLKLILKRFFFRTLACDGENNGIWKEGFGTVLIGGW